MSLLVRSLLALACAALLRTACAQNLCNSDRKDHFYGKEITLPMLSLNASLGYEIDFYIIDNCQYLYGLVLEGEIAVACDENVAPNIDSSLTWGTHIDGLCSRLGRACFALRRLAGTASRSVVLSCYFATVHSILTYGVELWARAADAGRAFSMQKRAVRAIVGVPDDVSCRELFKDLNIMPLPCELIYQAALFTHKNIGMCRQRGVSTSHALRSNRLAHLLVTPAHRLRKSERSVYVMGPSVYDRLPDTIRDATSTMVFKKRLRKWLLDNIFYSLDEFYELPFVRRIDNNNRLYNLYN